MTIRSTYTYVELEVSREAYDEIRRKLIAADYDHCFEIGDQKPEGSGPIDMHGLALIPEPPKG